MRGTEELFGSLLLSDERKSDDVSERRFTTANTRTYCPKFGLPVFLAPSVVSKCHNFRENVSSSQYFNRLSIRSDG